VGKIIRCHFLKEGMSESFWSYIENLSVLGGAGDRTQGLMYARQVLIY
jgi:hypothetical protein